MELLENLYKISHQGSERSMKNDKTYIRTKNKERQYYEVLCKRLSEKDRTILNKFIECNEKKIRRKNIHCFTAGFKTGLTVAVKSLE